MGVTDNESREIPKRNQKERKLIGMKSAILFTLATLTWASPAPQYSGQTQDLSEGQLDTIKDIFGTDAGDAYSGDQQTVDSAPLTDDSYSETKTADTAPLTDDFYSETKTVDAAPLTDGSYSEPKTAPQTEGSYEDAPPVKLTQGTYTEDTADLTGEVKAPGPVY